MKTYLAFHLLGALLCALLLGAVTTVGAAEPQPQGLPWFTLTPWPTPRVLQVGERFSIVGLVGAPTPVSVPAPRVIAAPPANFAPRVVPMIQPTPIPPANAAPPVVSRDGTSPTSALSADGATRTLAAGASVWYKIGSGGQHLDVFLDANPLSGMSLEVFAPGNLSTPIGRGTLQNSTGRLVWAGGHWRSQGDWFARVTNHNPMAVQYTLTSSARDISNKSCYSYWEYFPNGAYVYWTECQ